MNGEEGSDHPRPVQEKFSGALRWEIFCAFEKKPGIAFPHTFFETLFKAYTKVSFLHFAGGGCRRVFFCVFVFTAQPSAGQKTGLMGGI